jgi:ribonuclease HI
MEVLARTGWRKRLRRWVSTWLQPVRVYCDGSAHDAPGLPGGWAFLVVRGDRERLRGSGGARSATSTEMELRAALEGLRALEARGLPAFRCVELVSDCRHTVDVASGAPLPQRERDLAVELRETCQRLDVRARWIRGHAGEVWNERVDALAHEAKQAFVPERVKRKQRRRQARRR